MTVGSHCHEIVERYAEHCYRRKRQSDMEEGRRIASGYSADVREIMERWVENWRWEWGTVVSGESAPVEQQLWGTLPDGQRLSGHIDLLQCYEGAADTSHENDPFGAIDAGGDLWVVTDFKTGLYGDFHGEHVPLQQRIYAWLVQQNHEAAQAIECRLSVLRNGYQPEPWLLTGGLGYIGEELQSLCDRIAADEHCDPIPNRACIGCQAALACPCRDTETMRRILTDDPGDTLRQYLWHKGQMAALREQLQSHYAAGESASADGYQWGEYQSSPGVRVTDWQDLVALALEANDELTTSKTKLPGVARLLKPDKDLAWKLLASELYGERAGECLQVTAAPKPRVGLRRDGDAESDDGDDDQ
jgi:hypothetical protein